MCTWKVEAKYDVRMLGELFESKQAKTGSFRKEALAMPSWELQFRFEGVVDQNR